MKDKFYIMKTINTTFLQSNGTNWEFMDWLASIDNLWMFVLLIVFIYVVIKFFQNKRKERNRL
ncbi:hypothetical protein EDL98_02405 [Ornithobacterium rhinotracheale]|nr:hypothetical protein [Ornithobacterium rhinotracheale]